MKNYLTGCDILGADTVGDGMMGGGGMGGYGAILSSLVDTGTSIYNQQTAKRDAEAAAREANKASQLSGPSAAQEKLAALQAEQVRKYSKKPIATKPVEIKKPFFKTGGGIAVIVTLSVTGLGAVGFALYKGLKK